MSKIEHAPEQRFYVVLESLFEDGPYHIISTIGIPTEKTVKFPEGLNGYVAVRKSNLRVLNMASSPLEAAKLYLAKHEKKVQRLIATLDVAKVRLHHAAELQAFVEKTIKESEDG